MTLDTVPAGSDIFIDSNIFIYGLEGQSEQCKQFMERCSREELTGVCLFEVANDVTHKLMLAEAVQKRVISRRSPNDLKARFEGVKLLTAYWNETRRLLSLNLIFLPLSRPTSEHAQSERATSGLLTNDSMIVACMRELGVSYLATNDSDFERVSGITVFKPSDLP